MVLDILLMNNLQLILNYTGLGPLGKLILGLADKKLGEIEKAHRYRSQLNQALNSLQEAVKTEIHALYQQIADMVENQLETAYQQKIEAALVTLRQARELQNLGQQQSAVFEKVIHELLIHTEKSQGDLSDFQQRSQSAQTVIVLQEG